jgi:hypothetical protein
VRVLAARPDPERPAGRATGSAGLTCLYADARVGMVRPIRDASLVKNGAAMASQSA